MEIYYEQASAMAPNNPRPKKKIDFRKVLEILSLVINAVKEIKQKK